MKCSACGQIDHAGGCDLVEFYFFQRYSRAMERDPSPPSPLIGSLSPGCDVEAPLSPNIANPVSQSNTESAVVPNIPVLDGNRAQKTILPKKKTVDTPELVAKREEIRAKRVARMEYVRSCRKAANV